MQETIAYSSAVCEEIYAGGDEAIDVFCWRMEQLMRAGYSPVAAGALAERDEVDLHAACRLRVAGCGEIDAIRILL